MSNKNTPVASFLDFKRNTNWVTGEVEFNHQEYTFSAKLFDTGSEFGIDKGRVSKLSIKRKGTGFMQWDGYIVNYDRGWDIIPEKEEDVLIFKTVMELLENSPKRFE